MKKAALSTTIYHIFLKRRVLLALGFLILLSESSFADTTRYKSQYGFYTGISHYSSLNGNYDYFSEHLFMPPALEFAFLGRKQRSFSVNYQYYERFRHLDKSRSGLSINAHLVEANAWIPLLRNKGESWLWYKAGAIYRHGTYRLEKTGYNDLGLNTGLVARLTICRGFKASYSFDFAYFTIKENRGYYDEYRSQSQDPGMTYHFKNSIGLSYWW